MAEWIDLESGTSTTDINVKFLLLSFVDFYNPLTSQVTTTITFQPLANNSGSVASYKYKIDQENTSFVSLTTTNNSTFIHSGFVPGLKYTVTITAYVQSNATGNYSNTSVWSFTVPVTADKASIIATLDNGSAVIGNAKVGGGIDNSTVGNGTDLSLTLAKLLDSKNFKINKSLFSLSQTDLNSNKYTVAYKSFSQLDTSGSYYSFGTSLFFDAATGKSVQSGGLAFFVSNNGMDGYFLNIETTASAASETKRNEFKIYRLRSGVLEKLSDSQSGQSTSLTGIYGGQSYKIDIKIARDNNQVIITAYVNGFKIVATDNTPNLLITPTSNIAMICRKGTTYFDYVYGMTIDLESYNKDYLFNIYDGHYPNNILSFLYGEKVSLNDPTVQINNKGFIEEFGCVARELRVVKTKYDARPAFPIYASTGLNAFTKIIGERLTSSGAEIYVLNNSGTFIPLNDSEYYSFYIIGNTISQSSPLEYIENTSSQYTSQEPIIFESNWIQKTTDVKALGDWIKNVWSKKQMILKMSVFGNPLLVVGDIVTVYYPYHNLDTTKKFIITSINHSYDSGLETNITCRTI